MFNFCPRKTSFVARLVSLLLISTMIGCAESSNAAKTQELQQQAVQRQMVEELFNNALALLNDVEHSDSADDVLDQVVNRLNQWAGSRKPIDDWQVDPLAQSLADDVKQLPLFTGLDKPSFRRIDAFWLQEAIWLRNAARHTSGKINDPLRKAEALFDWTVRQVALEPVTAQTVPHAVWETMLLGRGTFIDRLWVFTLLARQQGLDVVALAVEKDGKAEPWAAGLLRDGKLYLFEPELGLPIRSPDGTIATLHDAATKPEILVGLDLDAEHPYRFHSGDLKKVVALIEASPPFLSERFRHVELRLVGDERLVLSIDATNLAEQLKQVENVADARLWTLPWDRAVAQLKGDAAYRKGLATEIGPFRIPPAHLWKGRVLHLMGRYSGDISATQHYQAARPADADVNQIQKEKGLGPGFLSVIGGIKQDATYWLGLVAFERGNFSTAREYLEDRLLKTHTDTRWRPSADYLIGRCYEAEGNSAEAIAAYRRVTGPQQAGAQLRAKQLTAKP